MTLQVIGAGFGRTGTMSLKQALEELGVGPCYHMVELMDHPEHARLWSRAAAGKPVDWDRLLGEYRATVDWPGCHFWSELAAAYPEAKVVLTVRDPERWYASARVTIFRHVVGPWWPKIPALVAVLARPRGVSQLIMLRRIMQPTFQGRFDAPRFMMDRFEAHNAAVRAGVRDDRLLVYEVGQGWGPLCEFLGVDVPNAPFPHVNDAAGFDRTFEDRFRRDRRVGLARIGVVSAALLGALALARSRAGRSSGAGRAPFRNRS